MRRPILDEKKNGASHVPLADDSYLRAPNNGLKVADLDLHCARRCLKPDRPQCRESLIAFDLLLGRLARYYRLTWPTEPGKNWNAAGSTEPLRINDLAFTLTLPHEEVKQNEFMQLRTIIDSIPGIGWCSLTSDDPQEQTIYCGCG